MTKLELFSSLLDDYRLVTEADFEELNHGKSIIVEPGPEAHPDPGQARPEAVHRRHGGGDLAPIPLVEPEPEPELPVVQAPAPVNDWRGFCRLPPRTDWALISRAAGVRGPHLHNL